MCTFATMKHRIYVASSWRNEYYPEVVARLREAGHEVYDFRNPPSGDPGFKWSSVSEDYMEWSPQQYRDMLHHPKAERQFHNDIEAMEACDVCAGAAMRQKCAYRSRMVCRQGANHDCLYP